MLPRSQYRLAAILLGVTLFLVIAIGRISYEPYGASKTLFASSGATLRGSWHGDDGGGGATATVKSSSNRERGNEAGATSPGTSWYGDDDSGGATATPKSSANRDGGDNESWATSPSATLFNNNLHEYDPARSTPKPMLLENSDNLVEYLYRRMVYVAAFSDSHFEETLGMLRSLEHCVPNVSFIIFDLGLNDRHKRYVIENHRVELRQFPFQDYSNLPHVKNLFSYAWKPIMFQLVAQEYDVLMYLDSSMRMKQCDIKSSVAQLLKFPLFVLEPGLSHFIELTHDGMVKYLQYPKDRKDLAHVRVHLRSGGLILWVNDTIQEKLIKPWVDCALHSECIAPKGATLWPCHFTSVHDGSYAGCHRYDQSALNVILAREFGVEACYKAINLSISDTTWYIKHL